MALIGAYQTGNWSSTSTWAKLISSSNLSTSGLLMSSASTFYSYTLTASNLTDAWRGIMIPFSVSRSNVGMTVTLQEYNGSSWSDTTATGTFYMQASTTQRARWVFCPFSSSYTPTTTTTGYYRVKIVFASGITSQTLYGASSTYSCLIVSASPASVPTIGDDIIITGDATKADGTTNKITVTVDADAGVGSGATTHAFPYNSISSFNAVSLDLGGTLKAHRTNSFTFKLNYGICQNLFDSNFDFGTVADPVTGNVKILMDTSSTTGMAPRRGVRYYGTQDTTTPYYTTLAGVQKTYPQSTLTSGVGTTASPLVTADAVDWSVGDQICIAGSGAYTTFAHTSPSSATYTAPTGYNRAYVEMTFSSAHSLRVGHRLTITGFTPSGYNGTWEVQEVPTTTTIRLYGMYGVSANATVIGVINGRTSQHEYRLIKTKNSSTSYVLSTVSGGTEDALQYTHNAGSGVYNLSSNLTMMPMVVGGTSGNTLWTSDAYDTGVATTSYIPIVYDSIRMDFGGGGNTYLLGILANGYTSGSNSGVINKCVFYATRGTLVYDLATSHNDWTITNNVCAGYYAPIITYFGLYGYNKSISNLYILDQTASVADAGKNTYNNVNIIGNNPTGANTTTDCLYVKTGSIGSIFTNCSFQGANTGTGNYGIFVEGATNFKFINCAVGTVSGNANSDVYLNTGYFTDGTFENCTFGSATLVNNYLNAVSGSEVRFHKYQATTNNHRWYTPMGKAISTASGLSDTTVRTAGSVNLRIDAENNSTGFVWEFKIPSTVNQQTFLNGFMQKNATFGTSVSKIELFLPGTDTTGVADSTYTLDNTTGSYQTFSVNKNYVGSVNALATVRITAITATAGAYLYVADIYNGQGALNLWDTGKPVSPIVPTDFSSIPGLVWSYPDTSTTASTMGQRQVDTNDEVAEILSNTDATQAKVDQLQGQFNKYKLLSKLQQQLLTQD